MGKLTHLLAATVLAATATTVLAGTAAAHTPYITADCTEKGTTLTVRLEAYSTTLTNSVKVTDGDTVLVETDFSGRFEDKWTVGADVAHTFTIVVAAGDDLDGERKWSFTKTEDVKACVTPTTTTTTTAEETTTTEVTTTEPTSTETTTATTSEDAPPSISAPPTTTAPPSEDDLADTGASIALPLGLGALLLVGGAAALILVRRRARQD